MTVAGGVPGVRDRKGLGIGKQAAGSVLELNHSQVLLSLPIIYAFGEKRE